MTCSAGSWRNSEAFLLQGTSLKRLDKPSDATLLWQRDWAFLQLRTNYTVGSQPYWA
jgi:hypothetical protein